MNRLITLTLLIATLIMPAMAAQPDKKTDDRERQQWFKEMRAKKHEFMVRELELTPQQQEPFFAIYDRLEDDLKAINDETRRLEKTVTANENATDAECDAVIDALYNQRYREWNAENQARQQLTDVLSKRQLIKLKRAEAKFTRALMKQHRHSAPRNKK